MTDTVLSEAYIQDCFHSYLRSSLAQAKAERLLDVEVLASAEGDLMITGPALVLFFAALRSTTTPPSVPLPRLEKHLPPAELSPQNCPPAYQPFLRVWSNAVAPIQALPPERQHDLARAICGLPPTAPDPQPRALPRLAADLRAVAIEISQRRSFQERYSGDLQAAIDAGSGEGPARGGPSSSVRAAFVPPPSYEDVSDAGSSEAGHSRRPSEAGHSQRPSPLSPSIELPPTAPLHIHRRTPSASASVASPTSPAYPPSPTYTPSPTFANGDTPSFPVPTIPHFGAPTPTHRRTHSAGPHAPSPGLLSPGKATPPLPARPHSPSLLDPHAPAIELIRETLYASLADVLARTPALRTLLKTDPPRAYFGAVALAVLDVSTGSVTRDGAVVGVLGQELTRERCPPPLRPLMDELAAIGAGVRELEERDSEWAVRALVEGKPPPPPKMDRVRAILEEGVGRSDARERRGSASSSEGEGEGRRSVEGRALAFANRINGLALRMTQLRPFRERQEEVFKVLAGVTG